MKLHYCLTKKNNSSCCPETSDQNTIDKPQRKSIATRWGFLLINSFLMVMLNMNLSRGQNIAGWDFQTTSSGGTAVIAYGPTFPKVYVANAGTGTLYLDGTNSSSLWNLNTSATTELNAFTGSGVNVGTGMTATTTSPACLALVSSSANGKFAVIKFSMTGRKNLIVSYSSQRTSSGFTSQKWEYSTDGSSWFPALTFVSGAVAGTITASFATTGVLSFSTTGLDNAATAYLRLTGAGATTITGNNRIDNIQLNADCIPQDDNNACTTDACNSLTGITTHTNVADGTSCNDGNPCTKNDVCINGTCKGSPIICVASDQCHDAGVCINGVCTDPAKANGSACNDGDPCTENDVCVNGACAGTPIVCPPLDQCHDAVCVNGVCTYLPKPDGTHCDDGDPCTKNDVCTNGTCAGTPIVCPPSADPCDGPGVCVNGICIYQPIVCPPSTDPCDGPGVCVNGICIYQPIVCPPSPDPCVTGVCVNGVCIYQPIVCPPSADPCVTGVCVNGVCIYQPIVCPPSADPCFTGVCVNGVCIYQPIVCPPSADPCFTGVCVNGVCRYFPIICPPSADPCDGPGVCVNGVCIYQPIVCIPPDQCHNAVCVNGVCQYPPKPDGATCDDGDPCTENDVCVNGVCKGTPIVCISTDQCHNAVCVNGVCQYPPKPNGAACNDGDPCTVNDVCVNGVCKGTPIVCIPPDQCHNAVCVNGVCQYPPKPNGTACNDGDPCTENDVCVNGTCKGTPIVCISTDQCHDAVCVNGVCQYPPKPDGATCDDGNPCTENDICRNGVCAGTPVNTDDGNPCTADACDPSTGVITHTLTCAALNATILIEGYYLGGGLMTNCYFTTLQSPDPSDADVITISAMDPVAPFGLVDAQTGRLKTNGDVSVTFGVAVVAGNSYYLKVNHRNSVETWSAVPVLLTTASTYSFSSATSQAFSGNEATTFDALYAAMYTGDINQDCAVDGSDFLILDPDIQAGAGGYIVTDLNGDGSVDGSDFLIFDPNSQNGVGCIIP